MNCLCSNYTRDTAKVKHTELHFMTNREFKKLLLMMMMMMIMMKVVKHLSTIPLNPIGYMWVQLQSLILGT
jgi:F0F1-type ATP synthase assembly protein I